MISHHCPQRVKTHLRNDIAMFWRKAPLPHEPSVPAYLLDFTVPCPLSHTLLSVTLMGWALLPPGLCLWFHLYLKTFSFPFSWLTCGDFFLRSQLRQDAFPRHIHSTTRARCRADSLGEGGPFSKGGGASVIWVSRRPVSQLPPSVHQA